MLHFTKKTQSDIRQLGQNDLRYTLRPPHNWDNWRLARCRCPEAFPFALSGQLTLQEAVLVDLRLNLRRKRLVRGA